MEKTAIKTLSRDPIIKDMIDIYGALEWDETYRDIYSTLLSSIISQQLSEKVADTIYKRFKLLVNKTYPLDPAEIIKLDGEAIRTAGISYSKIRYIKELSVAVVSKDIDLTLLYMLSDDEVIAELTKIKGIGVWTAEMVLIGALRRKDIFSIGDLGLKKAVSSLYGVDRNDNEKIMSIALQWKPYRTFASLYLWKSLA